MNPKVIYQDAFVLVVDKPTGWIVNEAETTKGQPTLQGWLRKNCRYPLAENNELRSGIVHRLDKDTSGVILIAKTEEAFRYLQDQFKERKIQKRYLALVHGKVEVKEGMVNAPVGRLPWNRKRFGVLPGGREAQTGYQIINHYQDKAGSFYSLLELSPKTGRTHQIRIHLKYLGHPVVADPFYAGRKTANRDLSFCPRLFLHASFLAFVYPKEGKSLEFASKLPEDLQSGLNKLKKIIISQSSLHTSLP